MKSPDSNVVIGNCCCLPVDITYSNVPALYLDPSGTIQPGMGHQVQLAIRTRKSSQIFVFHMITGSKCFYHRLDIRSPLFRSGLTTACSHEQDCDHNKKQLHASGDGKLWNPGTWGTCMPESSWKTAYCPE